IIYIKGEEKILKKSLYEVLEKMLSDQTYIERLCMNTKTLYSDLTDYIKSFFVELEKRGEETKDLVDAKFHFSNWLNSEKEKEQSQKKRSERRALIPTHAAANYNNDQQLKEKIENDTRW
ncbi:hypothetical protein JGH11_19570, partial [Dysgonomonas sp. Marseille-P4677]|nr:hypothetical protein [Dysgonomonas sp. Marseille-P4677]